MSLPEEGKPAPDFNLSDSKGESYSLSDFKGKKVVVYFYPKDNTPGCTQEACDFSENFSQFEKTNTVVIGISPDSSLSHQKFIQKYDLKHLLLSDEEKKTVGHYGVYQEKNMYGKKVMGVVRSTFVIDENGILRKIFPKVKVVDHWKEVLKVLSEID